ncbi:TonB-dependent receptor [candidate division KSB1 bacterium]|nr:TonB-dependent receptor [candidate division KSB1 bacterium]RQW06852.1 MAG: TonB-dependent receptor [candidate division KSB1 bacterium]
MKNIFYLALSILMTFLCALVLPVHAQSTGALAGRVIDSHSGEPLPGVNVTLSSTVLGAATDADGRFTIQRIPAGIYTARVTMIGYKHTEQHVTIQPNQTTNVDIQLQETVLETPEVMITANKRRQSIQESPNSVGVLTRRDFEQKNEIYLDKLLQYASGVNFVGTQVNIRGSSGFNYGAGSRVMFLIDGVPVMPGDSGDIKWDLIPATQIERVEIVKGAGSALYGSSALGGVINVITKKASSRPSTHLRVATGIYDQPRYAEWQWSSRMRNFTDIDIDHTRQLGDKSEILLAAGQHKSMGYIQNTEYLRHNASFKWNYRPTGTHNLTISLNYEGGDRETSLMWRSQRQALQVNPIALGDYVESQKYGATLFHQWVLRKNFRLQSRFSLFNNYWKNWYHDNITASTANKPGYEIQGDWQLAEKNSLIFGTEGSWDFVNSGLVGEHSQYILAGFIQNEFKVITNVNLTLGLRYDYQYVDNGFNDSQWSPKVGLVWLAQNYLRFRASSGQGFRVASMSERFPEGLYSGLTIIPNPFLKSETAWSHEIGMNINPSTFFYLDIAGFWNDYWDMIEPKPDENQVIQFINVTRARIAGVETMLKILPVKNLGFDIGYTWMDPYDIELDTTLAYRPRHILTTAITYKFKQLELGVDFRFVSKFERVEVYPKDDRVDQHVLNARAAYSFGLLTLGLNINNVFNYNYTQMERTLLPIRHYVVTLSSKF